VKRPVCYANVSPVASDSAVGFAHLQIVRMFFLSIVFKLSSWLATNKNKIQLECDECRLLLLKLFHSADMSCYGLGRISL